MIEHIVLNWIWKDSKLPAEFKNGKYLLRYGWKLHSIYVVLLGIVLSLVAFALPFVEAKDTLPVLGLIAMFSAFGIPIYLEARHRIVAYDHDCIYSISTWSCNKVIKWNDVVLIKFSPGMQWWIVKTSEHGDVKIGMYMRGVHTILREGINRGILIETNGWDPGIEKMD